MTQVRQSSTATTHFATEINALFLTTENATVMFSVRNTGTVASDINHVSRRLRKMRIIYEHLPNIWIVLKILEI
jgi:hypothetical protein